MIRSKLVGLVTILFLGAFVLTSCEAIGGIFKAGVWTGTIAVVLILIVVIYIVAKLFSGKKNQ